jgi:hypothetical protein
VRGAGVMLGDGIVGGRGESVADNRALESFSSRDAGVAGDARGGELRSSFIGGRVDSSCLTSIISEANSARMASISNKTVPAALESVGVFGDSG